MKSTLVFRSKHPSIRALLFSAILASFTHHAQAVTFAVSQVFDENTFATNVIDSQAPGNAVTSSIFATNVSSAFTANQGGIINFDRPNGASGNTDGLLASEAMSISYGAGKTLSITSNAAYDIHNFLSLTGISGTSADVTTFKGLALNSASVYSWTLNFGAITGGTPGERVTTAGFGLLSRNGISQTITVEWFLNGSSTSSTTQTDTISAGAAADDTFFSFSAPINSFISGFKITLGGTTGDLRLGVDDLGFITSVVPEPSRALLLTFGATALCLFRRRGSC